MEIIEWFKKIVLIERNILIWGILFFMFFSWGILFFMFFSSLITYFIMR